MNTFQKQPPIKNKKLTAEVKGQPCYLQFPDICRGRQDTVVPCHSPLREDNQGCGQKSHDFLAVPGCIDCHNFLDSRTHAGFSPEIKKEYYHIALKRWIAHLFRVGVLMVK